MTARSLVSYSSPVAVPPTFLVPVFAVPGTNQVCAQDLDPLSRVTRFLPFDPDSFYPVSVLPPVRAAIEGGPGLLAFWLNSDTVLVDEESKLRRRLTKLDETALPPFAAVEVMTLVRDVGRLDAAARRASRLRKNIDADDFAARAAYRLKIASSMRKALRKLEANDFDHIDDAMAALQREMSAPDWIGMWDLAIRRFGLDDKLKSVAQWKVPFLRESYYEGILVQRIARYWFYDLSNDKFVFEWLLSHTRTADPYWPEIWQLARQIYSSNDALERAGVDYIDECLERGVRLYGALTVWRALWQSKFDPDLLVRKANAMVENGGLDHDRFNSLVTPALLHTRYEEPWLSEYLIEWLEVPRVNNAYVSILIEFGLRDRTDDYVDRARYWLEDLGAGSNQWEKLWLAMQRHLPRAGWIDLAFRWLLRARPDLKSWLSVFYRLADIEPFSSSPRLGAAAERWYAYLGDRPEYQRDRRIRSLLGTPLKGDDRQVTLF